MVITALESVLHNLRRSLVRQEEASRTDGELLECFIARRDEWAFLALMRRHGPMVLGVCQRVLRNEADAEDAFQATFLVLVRKAGSIRPAGRVGNWLYGVAHTTALKARAMNSKRLAKEHEAAALALPEVTPATWEQVQRLLHQELKALPDRYRTAIVLCDLEGRTIKEAARQLGCPQGTIGTRLVRGRCLLARRLARHGLPLSGGALVTAILPKTASARVPAPLLAATSRAANLTAAGQAVSGVVCCKVAVLTEGVLKAMFLTNLKTVTAVVFLLAGLISAGLCYSTAVGQAKEESVAQAPGQGEPARQGATTDARQLLAERFEEVQKLIRPRPGESRWMEIPWQSSLWEARKKAAAEGKPMFVWSGSGGPPCVHT